MEWIAIVTMIVEMIQKCREDRDNESITAIALNRPVGRWLIRREMKSRGLRGKKLRAAMQKVSDYKMSDSDVEAFVENA
jgi:Cys-tRNA synthase (O-phospho-L-seryl-tRNA:Cys-tRNA synthase)